MIPIPGDDPGDEGIRENQNGNDGKNPAQEVDEVIDLEGIDRVGEEPEKAVNCHHTPDLDRRPHLAVKLPEAKIGVLDIAEFPGRKLEDLRILVPAEVAEIREAGDSRYEQRQQGIPAVTTVI